MNSDMTEKANSGEAPKDPVDVLLGFLSREQQSIDVDLAVHAAIEALSQADKVTAVVAALREDLEFLHNTSPRAAARAIGFREGLRYCIRKLNEQAGVNDED